MRQSGIRPNGRQSLLRYLVAAVSIIALTATAIAVAGLLQVNTIAGELGASPSIASKDVKLPPAGAPQTLLLIGSDHRAGESYQDSNTDTMLLIRLDASSNTINLLSIPRDLEVKLPNGTMGKLNAAYTVGGGPDGLIKTLKTQVFPGFQVNHIIDINFTGFSDLIDSIGCVDADVDHRYFNVSSGVVGDPNNYSSIDIQPGYQKLCGHDQSVKGALPFVRFRHTDTDLVRNARQQDFLRWARTTFSLSDVISHRNTLLRIIGRHGQTDHNLHTTDGILNLIDLILHLNSTALNQIKFPAQISACGGSVIVNGVSQVAPCYVTARHRAESQVYQQFMATSTPGVPTTTVGVPPTGNSAPAKKSVGSSAGVTGDAAHGLEQAAALGRSGLPVYYPTDVYVPAGGPASQYCSDITGNCTAFDEPDSAYTGSYPRQYLIHSGGHSYRSYRITAAINSTLGEFYGIQGTAWRNAPIIAKPTKEMDVGGRRLLEFFNGSRLTMVAWRTPNAAYWVSNSLTGTIPNRQLLQIAESMRLYHP